MPLRAIALAALATVLTFALAPGPASAQTRTRHDTATAARKKPQARVPVAKSAPASAPRIACTIGGCRPVPPNCTTTMGQTWTAATGYEIIECP